MGLTLLLSLYLWMDAGFTVTSAQNLWIGEPFRINWIPSLGIQIHLALDGLSLLMVVLTAFLGILAIVCSWTEGQRSQGFFHLNLLWILGGVMGVFMAVDMFLFFFFWEIMLVPMYFLIALWGIRGLTAKPASAQQLSSLSMRRPAACSC